MDNLEELKAHLMATDGNFRSLAEQHSDYDHQLIALESKNELTEEEQVEEVRLKKMKLRLKDQMAERIRSYESSHATA